MNRRAYLARVVGGTALAIGGVETASAGGFGDDSWSDRSDDDGPSFGGDDSGGIGDGDSGSSGGSWFGGGDSGGSAGSGNSTDGLLSLLTGGSN